MSAAADTSIVLPALLSDHEAHEAAADALGTCTTTIAHVALEAYSVLTRLPPPRRADAATAAAVLQARLGQAFIALEAKTYASSPSQLAAAGVSGGSAYDGLIALTALEHDVRAGLSRHSRRSHISCAGCSF